MKFSPPSYFCSRHIFAWVKRGKPRSSLFAPRKRLLRRLNAKGNSYELDSLQSHTLFVSQAPSTLIHFQTKAELFCSRYGHRPHCTRHSKTLGRVERFEMMLFELFSSVDGENDAIWKRWRRQNRHDRASHYSTVSIQNGRQTLPCGFSLDHRCSVDGRSRYENDKCGRKCFCKWSKTAPFSLEKG